jgi:hypothetical protein
LLPGFLAAASGISGSTPSDVDLSLAIVVIPPALSGPEQQAVRMLVEEVEKRTMIHLKVLTEFPAGPTPLIVVGPASQLPTWCPWCLGGGKDSNHADTKTQFAGRAEGYRIWVDKASRAAPTVLIVGNDARGVLFGVGRLLRELQMTRGKVVLPGELSIATAPKFPLRGHQLGYRPKTNSYDGWTPALWEQYIRDLAAFGTNAIELIPPRSDDAPDSPHFPLPPMEMMIRMSKLAHDYGLDVWIWYPALDADYSNPATVESAVKQWGEVFDRLPRIDAVFVPGGDPGHTEPKFLMALLEKQTRSLHRSHPTAQMWVSPQGFNRQWMEEFCAILQNQKPAWLNGVVYGPQVSVSLPQLRAAVPQHYPIRLYPDITHSLRCQYPVPAWDLAYALTEAREVINPRPIDEAAIFRACAGYMNGFIAYSEGCNDDVNKIVWSSLGWDPEKRVDDILQEYSRYFIGANRRDDFTAGLLALERNWRGPLATNESVYRTLEHFQKLEKTATPQERLNWRFQQALYRAYYDAYERSRLIYETDLERKAEEKLRAASQIGTLAALDQAEAILKTANRQRVSADWHARVFELAEALFQSIRMQLSVERYQAISVGRGANLDTIDVPLNNRVWLLNRFSRLRALVSENERLAGIEEILRWTDPGPGGFYDDLGNPLRQPHLLSVPAVGEASYEQDPEFRSSPLIGFAHRPEWRLSWCDHADALFDAPLTMRYTGLDPKAHYKLRIVYAGDNFSTRVRLLADDRLEIHPLIKKPDPVRPLEFVIPADTTGDGELVLTWYQEPGKGGSGRGCQVAEVWLIRQ